MKIEIPAFLKEMSEQINSQDNRMTAEPMFMVCYDEWLTAADGRGEKEIILLCDDGEYYEAEINDHTEIFDHMKKYHPEWCMELIRGYDDYSDDIDDISNYLDFEDIFVTYPGGVTIEKLSMQKTRKIVKASLTEDGAEQFIKRKQHDYPPLYIYAESMCFQWQMIELRNWIKSLTNSI